MLVSMLLKADIFLEQPNKLIQGCIDGDRYSQSQLYELFAPQMFVICLRYSMNRQEAEEILQEGFLKVYKHIHQFRFAGSFTGWIKRIMVNCALQRYRINQRIPVIINIDAANLDHLCNENIISQLNTKELLRTIQLLPPAYRMVFNLYVFEGMKHREIAQQLGISEGTSKSNLFEARLILQRRLNNNLIFANQNY